MKLIDEDNLKSYWITDIGKEPEQLTFEQFYEMSKYPKDKKRAVCKLNKEAGFCTRDCSQCILSTWGES